MDEAKRNEHLLRVGYYDRANLVPLLYPLQAGWVLAESPWKVEIVNNTPAALTRELLDGNIDAAFVPSTAVWMHGKEISALGGLGIISEGAAGTTLLLAPLRMDMMDGAALEIAPEAKGSAAEYLLRTLFKPYYDIALVEGESSEPAGGNVVRLMYGDGAAREGLQRTPEAVAEDLGVAWFVTSGLPMVWELFATNRGLNSRKPGAEEVLQNLIAKSQRAAREQQSTILDEVGQRLGVDQPQVKEFLGRQRFSLGEREQKGLAQFLDMATRGRVFPR